MRKKISAALGLSLNQLGKNLLLLFLLLAFGGNVWGQQVIGSFPTMDGGFEGQTIGALGTSLSTTTWSRQNQSGASSTITTTSPRSGSKYTSVVSVSTASRNLQSPQSATASAGPSANTSYVVQYYVRNASSVNSFQSGVTTNGTSNPVYSTASTLVANSSWFKYTQVITTSTTTVASAGIGIAGRAASGNFDVDDFVIYAGSSVDTSAPNSPGTVTINNNATNPQTSLDLSWVAASGGLDGGGYVVVRYTVSPNANNDPNQNGIYAVGNTITNGTGALTGTVRYIGTGTSFTDSGLTPGTSYYYKVYTVDKAFNYSAESSANHSTTSSDSTPPSLSSLNPTNGAVNVLVGSNLVATFDENVAKGTGNIIIKRYSDDSVVETIDVTSSQVTVSGATVTIDPTANLASNTHYYLEIASTAIKDLANNNFAGISGNAAWNFTTEVLSPNINLSTTTLSGFNYLEGFGPSAEQMFTISGQNLTGNVILDAPANYEISKSTGTGFGASISFTPAELASAQNVYVHLKSGLSASSSPYNSENIAISGGGITTQNVVCNGTVTANTTVSFANIQFPTTATIAEGSTVDVYAQAYKAGLTEAAGQATGLVAWIGYSSSDSNPNGSGWTWIPATFNVQAGNNDEFVAALGTGLTPGTYYYASRFQIDSGEYVYGGTSGVWSSNSGVLTVNSNVVGYANVQSPFTGTIVQGGDFNVYSKVYKSGYTEAAGANANISGWIGYSTINAGSTSDFATATWTWVPATFNVQVLNDDEYVANIGTTLSAGTYYYVSRYQVAGSTEYKYGGINNNFWGAPENSGVLTVQTPREINVKQGTTNIATGGTYNFGNQAFGTSSSAITFTVENEGQESLSVGTLSISGTNASEFAITQVDTTLPHSVSGGGNTTFTVTFSPTGAGSKTAQLSLVNDDANESPYIINLTGVGGPANDNCSGAIDLTVNANPVTGDVLGATLSSGYSNVSGANPNDDVWYKFNSPIAASYTVRVKGSTGFDAVFEIRDSCGRTAYNWYRDANADGGEEVWTFSGLANTTYNIRVYDYENNIPATTTFTIQVTSDSVLSTNGTTSLAFGNVNKGSNSASQSFNLSGYFLTGSPAKITVNAPTNYEVSLDGANWASSVDVEDVDTDAAIAALIYVRFNTTNACGASNGNITFTGGGITTPPIIALTATAIVPTPIATAATDITDTSFTAHWDEVSNANGYELDVYKKESTAAPELITNGSFETGSLTGWTFAANLNQTVSTSQKHSGTHSLYISSSHSTGNREVSQSVSGLEIGKQYKMSLWYFSDTSSSNDAFRVWSSNPTIQLPSTSGYYGSVKSSWQNIESTFTANATSHTFVLRFYSGARIYLDDISIRAVDNVETKTYVSGYNPKTITGGSITSDVVTGLTADTQYHYVVRAITSTCESSNSNEIDVKTDNTVVWDGTAWSNIDGPSSVLNSKITGTYNIPMSFETNNLEITDTGSLDIQAAKDVTVHGNIILPADNKITVESDGSLVQKNTGADNNSSNTITVKRTALLPTKGYTLWSSPVASQNLYSFSDGYNQALGSGNGTPWNRFYVYRESSDTFVTANTAEGITLSNTSVFDAGRGYAIRGKNSYTPSGGTGVEMPAAADLFTFNGKMNNGPVSSQLLKNSCGTTVLEADCLKGYNMIGNPYPSNLDFDALYAANNSKIYGTAYFWTNNDMTAASTQQSGSSYNGNNYAIYNMTGGTPAVEVDLHQPEEIANPIPNGIVKVGQGFIIKAKKVGAGQTVDFTNAMRVGHYADAHFYNAKKAEKNRFWLRLTSPSNIANTLLVGHIPGATNNFEIDYDGELFVLGSDAFYSVLGNKKLAIQGRADFNTEDVIPVGTKYASDGTYKISLSKKEGLFSAGQQIYLLDKVTNTYTDLTTRDYTFSAVKGTDETRFEIVYKNKEVLGTDTISKSDFIVYKDADHFVIKSSQILGKVELYDASGRLVMSKNSNEKQIRIDSSALSSGVYIIKADNSGNIRTKKLLK